MSDYKKGRFFGKIFWSPYLLHEKPFTQMKIGQSFFILLILIPAVAFQSCKKDDPVTEDPFTSITWGKPNILHKPPGMGWFVEVNCPAGCAYKYNSDGSYSFDNYCLSTHLDGEWSWMVEDEKLKLDTYYNGIFQYAYEIDILEVTSERLHTIVRMVGTPEAYYYEYMHYPRTD
jgi:hypothetical protein